MLSLTAWPCFNWLRRIIIFVFSCSGTMELTHLVATFEQLLFGRVWWIFFFFCSCFFCEFLRIDVNCTLSIGIRDMDLQLLVNPFASTTNIAYVRPYLWHKPKDCCIVADFAFTTITLNFAINRYTFRQRKHHLIVRKINFELNERVIRHSLAGWHIICIAISHSNSHLICSECKARAQNQHHVESAQFSDRRQGPRCIKVHAVSCYAMQIYIWI